MKPIDRKAVLLMVATVLGILSFSCPVSGGGLSVRGNQLWDQDSPGIEGTAGGNDLFGYALATGDFDGNRRADLAVGIPEVYHNGEVLILYGYPDDLPWLLPLILDD